MVSNSYHPKFCPDFLSSVTVSISLVSHSNSKTQQLRQEICSEVRHSMSLRLSERFLFFGFLNALLDSLQVEFFFFRINNTSVFKISYFFRF